MKYKRITERTKKPLTMSMWTSDGESLKVYNRLAKLENKIEDGELISTVQDEQSEQEIEFFVEHNSAVRKQAVKEFSEKLRDKEFSAKIGSESVAVVKSLDIVILVEEVFGECIGSVHGDPVGAPGAPGDAPAIKKPFPRPSSTYNKEQTVPRGKAREHRRQKR